MMRSSILVLMLIAGGTCPGMAQQQRVVRAGADMGSWVKNAEIDGAAVEIPITLASTQILVDDVFVNGEGPFRFMLDTGGMGGGRVDTSLAEKLGLEKVGEVTGSDGSARPGTQMATYELTSLAFGGLRYEGVRVLSRDYNQHGASVRGHIDGILGFALFEEFLLTIDYAGRRLRVETGELPEPDDDEIVECRTEGAPIVEVQLEGRTFQAHLDTGSMGPVSITQELADSLLLASDPVVVGQARTVTGAFDIQQAQLAGELWIGGQVIEQPQAVIGIPMQTINLGGQVLRDFVLTFDQRNERLRILRASVTRPESAPAASNLGRQPIQVPMPFEMGRPMIEARINGQGPYRFILDTGAGVTVLFSSLVAELGLEATGTTQTGDPSGKERIDANTHLLDSIQVGSATFTTVSAIELSMGGVGNVQGVMGLPVFHDAIMTMDFDSKTMTLSRGALSSGDGSVQYLVEDTDHINVEVDVAGELVRGHIDTGSPGNVAVPLNLAEDLPLDGPPQVIGRARTVSGAFEVLGARLEGDLSFAGITLEDPQLTFNDRFRWANIGNQALAGHALVIDQVNRRIRFDARGEEIEEPVAEQPQRIMRRGPSGGPSGTPRYGVAMAMRPDGGMQVSRVLPGSIAEAAGLRAGDLILKLNGSDVAALEQAQKSAAFGRSPLNLTVQREGQEVEIRMQLPDGG